MKILGPISLIKKALNLYFNKLSFYYFLKLALINTVVVFVGGFLFGLLGIFDDTGGVNAQAFNQLDPRLILGGVLFGILITIWGMWFNIAQIQASSSVVKGTTGSIRELLTSSRRHLWKYFLAVSLVLLIVLGGLVLLVVPGIIFSIWFVFVPLIVSLEDIGVKAALTRSKELIKGRVQAVFGRMLVFVLLAMVVQFVLGLIPYVGPLLFLIISPFFALLGYLLYSEVKASPQPQE